MRLILLPLWENVLRCGFVFHPALVEATVNTELLPIILQRAKIFLPDGRIVHYSRFVCVCVFLSRPYTWGEALRKVMQPKAEDTLEMGENEEPLFKKTHPFGHT